MKNIFALCLSFVSLISFWPPFTVFAQEEPFALEQVVVTATRYEEPVSSVPAYVTLITEEDIENSPAKDIPELLRTQTGLHVNDITGNRRTYIVDLRGFGETASSNTLVLVDGRRINQSDLSGVDWTLIPLKSVRRIEILRGGSGSVLYGDNATGGVINIVTKEGDAVKTGGEIAAGSYDTVKADAYAGGNYRNLNYYFSGNYLNSDGYRENSGTEARNAGVNLIFYATDFLQLHFRTGYHKDDTGLPGALKESDYAAGASKTDSLHSHDFMNAEDYYFEGGPVFSFLGENIFKIDLSFRKRDFLSFSSGDFGNFTGDSEIKTVTVSPQVLLKNSFGKTKNTFILGFDYSKAENDIVNQALFFGEFSVGVFDLEKKNYGYYLHDEIFLADSLFLSAGYRYDNAEFTFSPSTPDQVDMQRDLYTAGLNYNFKGRSYVYCSYSASFRYPLLDELYSFFTNTVNTGLHPQTSDDYEIGARYYFTDVLYAHLNLFRIDTDEEIFFNPTTYTNENLNGRTNRKGLEISFSAKPLEWLTAKAGYTFTDSEIEEGTFKGNDVPNVPKHQVVFNIEMALGKGVTAVLNGRYTGKRPFISDFANAFSDQDSYVLLNSRLQYHWKSLNAFVNINNITDEDYSEYGVIGGFPVEKAFYPSPRINFLAGLSVEL